jgi:hypothetical protein
MWPFTRSPGKWKALILKFGARFNYSKDLIEKAIAENTKINEGPLARGYDNSLIPFSEDRDKLQNFLKWFSSIPRETDEANKVLHAKIIQMVKEIGSIINKPKTSLTYQNMVYQFADINKALDEATLQKGGGKWKLLVDAIRETFIINNDYTLQRKAIQKIDALKKGDFEGKKKVILETFTPETVNPMYVESFKRFIAKLSEITEADEEKRPTLIVDMALGLRDPGIKST